MSELKSRLHALRRASGGVPRQGEGPERATGGPSIGELKQRLERLGATRRRMSSPRRCKPDDGALTELLGGERIADGLLRIEQHLAFGSRHDGAPIDSDNVADALCYFSRHESLDASRVVFLDTETTGLAGGTGTVAFVLGVGKVVEDRLQVTQYFLTGFGGERAMLEVALESFSGARLLVSYNGLSFDQPLLATRFRLCALPEPLSGTRHLDLLHLTRGAFGPRWPDCRLTTAEQRLLGLARDDDLPGSEAPEAWAAWLRCGDTRLLARVLEHNRRDIVSLAELVAVLRHCYVDPVAWSANTRGCRRRMRSDDEDEWYEYLWRHRARLEEDESLELARLARRRGDWHRAVAVWRECAAAEHPEALERLAKYHEHVDRDLPRALDAVVNLMNVEPHQARHRHRLRRLQRKLGA